MSKLLQVIAEGDGQPGFDLPLDAPAAPAPPASPVKQYEVTITVTELNGRLVPIDGTETDCSFTLTTDNPAPCREVLQCVSEHLGDKVEDICT